ncbi:hypothetical protein [Rhodococcus sp. HNM0569]|uniref:hypothetical protein n=1 Tax=Rhodococcus sp. HNM0569 TaxID=2716340 RepID=UPI00146DFAD8|nr:hypothetical protein [Rhodococcus sp. HNM0569]NLU82854.1 hypothetical protein [Rhodococcus sp. HNM0569]
MGLALVAVLLFPVALMFGALFLEAIETSLSGSQDDFALPYVESESPGTYRDPLRYGADDGVDADIAQGVDTKPSATSQSRATAAGSLPSTST